MMRLVMATGNEADAIINLLRKDGWQLSSWLEDNKLKAIAKHPEVIDQKTIRDRLNNLGLLTSRNVQIHFVEGALSF